ncbi:unnamed protein product [Gongylonema pulchrum]|uniref:Cation_ATPase_N domain-containing protein n=1 Tax=Gongylonema pulchrum TaxID=637853 RepID=A0A183E046_9BILA|nr:unnamed protein product [Gongylonema pulchrum]
MLLEFSSSKAHIAFQDDKSWPWTGARVGALISTKYSLQPEIQHLHVLFQQFKFFLNLYFLLMACSQDRELNSEKYEKLTPQGIDYISSSKIKVGDLIIIQKDKRVPADVVLLRTTEKSGASFIRTDQLDGETDWKLRIAVPVTQNLSLDQVSVPLLLCVFAVQR